MSRVVRLAFGRGISRAVGQTVAEPSAMDELFNVHTKPGRLEMRLGLERALRIEGARAILALNPGRRGVAGSAGLVYHIGDEAKLALATIRGDGTFAVTRSHPLFTFDGQAPEPPVVVVSDSYDALYYAHAERLFARRQPTKRFVPSTPGTAPTELTADFGDGPVPLKFYGVEPYLDYLLGWGYGDPDKDDAPSIIRVSLPGLTDQFDPQHYIPAGQPDDPIITVKRIPDGALVFKRLETYRFVGTTRPTFGVVLADALHGLVGPRLAITVGGVVYFWSAEGPRRSAGGPSEDLAFDLNLRRPPPWDDQWTQDQGFATYLPERREVLFVFGSHAYAYHLNDGQWSYREWNAGTIGCAGVLEVDLDADAGDTGNLTPEILSAACVAFTDLYPVLTAAACKTAPAATAALVPPITVQAGVRSAPNGRRLDAIVPWTIGDPPEFSFIGIGPLIDSVSSIPVVTQSWADLAQSPLGERRTIRWEVLLRIRRFNAAGALQFTDIKRMHSQLRPGGFPLRLTLSSAFGVAVSKDPSWPVGANTIGSPAPSEGSLDIEMAAFPRDGCDMMPVARPGPTAPSKYAAIGATRNGDSGGGDFGFVDDDSGVTAAASSIQFYTGVVVDVVIANQPSDIIVEITNLSPEYAGGSDNWTRTFEGLQPGRHQLAAKMDALTFNWATYPNGMLSAHTPDRAWYARIEVTVKVRVGGVGGPEITLLDAVETTARLVDADRPGDHPADE